MARLVFALLEQMQRYVLYRLNEEIHELLGQHLHTNNH